jgi:hypothetical protein
MARQFGATITIDRPIKEVFAFLADGENDKKFSSRIIEIVKTTPGEPGRGTVYKSTTKDLGLETKHEFELTEFESPTRIRWTELSRGPLFVPVGGYDFAPANGGTQLTFFNELEGRGIAKLLLPLVLRIQNRGAPAFVKGIKDVIEAEIVP